MLVLSLGLRRNHVSARFFGSFQLVHGKKKCHQVAAASSGEAGE